MKKSMPAYDSPSKEISLLQTNINVYLMTVIKQFCFTSLIDKWFI